MTGRDPRVSGQDPAAGRDRFKQIYRALRRHLSEEALLREFAANVQRDLDRAREDLAGDPVGPGAVRRARESLDRIDCRARVVRELLREEPPDPR